MLSHINVYEKMFHRIDSPDVIAAAETKIDEDDMVLAVEVEGIARAYPVRSWRITISPMMCLGESQIVSTY